MGVWVLVIYYVDWECGYIWLDDFGDMVFFDWLCGFMGSVWVDVY